MPTPITDRLYRGSLNSAPFALAWESDLKLSKVTVVDITERDNIPEWKRFPFMEADVLSDGKKYKLGADATIAGQAWTDITAPTLPSNIVTEDEIFDIDGYIQSDLIRNIFLNDSYVVASQAAMLALTTVTGNFVIRTDTSAVYVKLNNDSPSELADFAELTFPGAVISVNGLTGAVTITLAGLIAAELTVFNDAVAASPSVTGLNSAVAAINITIGTIQGNIDSINTTLLEKADLVAGLVPVVQLPAFQNPITAYDEGSLISSSFTGIDFLGAGVTVVLDGAILRVTVSGGGGGGGGSVTSVFGRSGAVVAGTNDYTWAQIDKTTSNLNDITTRLFSSLQSIPTTLAGYGITDPIVLTSGSYANPSWITSLDAAKITTGILPLSVIPAAALERVYIYAGGATLPENAGLTTTEVQNGDVVKVNTTGIMYVVTNDAALSSASSFVAYNAGTAASVPWSGVTGTPTTLAGYGITNAWNTGTGASLSAINTITSNIPNSLNFAGTWTATANNNYAISYSPTITARSTTFDGVRAMVIEPTITGGADSQDLIGLLVRGTFNTGGFVGVLSFPFAVASPSENLFRVRNDGIIELGNSTTKPRIYTTATGISASVTGTNFIWAGTAAFVDGIPRFNLYNNITATATSGAYSVLGSLPQAIEFSPASGTASFTYLNIRYRLGTTGSYVGTNIGIDYNPDISSVVGLTNIAFRNTTGKLLFGGTTLTAGSVLADFQSTTEGVLFPRVTNIASITTPVNGMAAYDAATNLWSFRQSGNWLNLWNRLIVNINSTTSAGSISATDYIYICTSTFTITLPTAVGNTNRYTIKNSGVGIITINTTSSQTIDGLTSTTLPTQYDVLEIISNGTNWIIV